MGVGREVPKINKSTAPTAKAHHRRLKPWSRPLVLVVLLPVVVHGTGRVGLRLRRVLPASPYSKEYGCQQSDLEAMAEYAVQGVNLLKLSWNVGEKQECKEERSTKSLSATNVQLYEPSLPKELSESTAFQKQYNNYKYLY